MDSGALPHILATTCGKRSIGDFQQQGKLPVVMDGILAIVIVSDTYFFEGFLTNFTHTEIIAGVSLLVAWLGPWLCRQLGSSVYCQTFYVRIV